MDEEEKSNEKEKSNEEEKSVVSWKDRREKIKHSWQVPFIFLEWICEHISFFLGRSAFFKILEYAGRLTILVAIIFYFLEADERRLQSKRLQMQVDNLELQVKNQKKVEHYQAWQVINSARGRKGSGGRIAALNDLYDDGISLAGLDISKAKLSKLKLKNADLSDANLSGADLPEADLYNTTLTDANLAGANLTDAILSKAKLERAKLIKTWLYDANLPEAVLTDANLVEAELTYSDLSGANLTNAKCIDACFDNAILFKAEFTDADFTNADLNGAILTEAVFTDANFTLAKLARSILSRAVLEGADLTGADLREADLTNTIEGWKSVKSIKFANIRGVRNPPDGFIDWAKGQGAVQNDEEWKKLIKEKMPEATKKRGGNDFRTKLIVLLRKFQFFLKNFLLLSS